MGHFYVAVGHLSHRYHPADFFGSQRAEAETSIIPALWHETGVEVSGAYRGWRYQVQLVNGLDATGFSSQNWTVGGHQKRFETIQATNMAWVAAPRLSVRAALCAGYFRLSRRQRRQPPQARYGRN